MPVLINWQTFHTSPIKIVFYIIHCVSKITFSPSPKKMKKRQSSEAASGQVDVGRIVAFVTGQTAEAPHALVSLDTLRHCGTIGISDLTWLEKILGEIPLEYLSTVQLRCQLGMLCVLSNLQACHMTSLQSLQCLLQRCLSVSNLSKLFQCVQPNQLIQFSVWFTLQVNC